MSLLTDVINRPLDPGYAAAAKRREQQGQQPGPGQHARSALAIMTLLVIGVLLAAAFWQTRGTRPAGVQAREQLAAEIARQDAAAARLERSNAALLQKLQVERKNRLQVSQQGQLADEVANLALVTGASAVSGPGITVTLDDAPAARPTAGADPREQLEAADGRVLDQDLQLVVNGLWDAGAEAISINGQRLTALAAIRSAGEAILVDYRPLAPPYVVSAIGDPDTLSARFSNGPGGRDVQYLKDNFGVRVAIASRGRLDLPASAGLDTRRAKAVGGAQSSATSTASPSSTKSPKPSKSSPTTPGPRPQQETP
jgi:uncharacterized protein YlxW (UPF0749 family)